VSSFSLRVGVVSLITNDGRNIVVCELHISLTNNKGFCKGSDQYTNIVLERCYERVFSKDQGVEIVELGLYVVRGDNM
jgi:U6 snRNA-associated Sm-like protein LSm8